MDKMEKEFFEKLSQELKLDAIYDLLTSYNDRLIKLEGQSWWNRFLYVSSGVVGGVVAGLILYFK
jgi:hypothetical protein